MPADAPRDRMTKALGGGRCRVERVGVVSDTEHRDYSVRLFRLYDACRDHGRNVTTKTLDAYLLAAPL